jgi:hypothetical protein
MQYGFYQIHRGLFSVSEIAELRAACVAVFAEFSIENKMSFRRVVDVRHKRPDAMAHLETVLNWFWTSSLPRLFKALHEHEPALMIEFMTVRRHTAGETFSHVQWHADANFGSENSPMLVCWVPLDPVGETAPSLQFCTPRLVVSDFATHRAKWSAAAEGNSRGVLSDYDLDDLYGPGGYRVETPILNIGDCCTFDRFTVHRTQPMAMASTHRHAIEFRVVSRSIPPSTGPTDSHIVLSVRDGEDVTILKAGVLYNQDRYNQDRRARTSQAKP